MKLEIVNIVTSGSLGQRVDLTDLAYAIPEFSYDPKGYHGGYLKLTKYTATIYSSGKYIIPGVKSLEDIDSNHQELIRSFQNILDTKLIQKAEIKNMVAYSSIGHELNLFRLYANLTLNTDYEVSYEPEVFPGLCIKTDIGSSNIYRNGKYLLLGAVSEEQLIRLRNQITSLLAI